MHAAALRIELRIPGPRSLKEKRAVMRRLMSLLDSFPISAAEIDHQDQWQRTTLGIAAVAAQASQLERVIHSVRRALEGTPDVEVLEVGVSYLEAVT